jgi:hypothetical protein
MDDDFILAEDRIPSARDSIGASPTNAMPILASVLGDQKVVMAFQLHFEIVTADVKWTTDEMIQPRASLAAGDA